MNNSNNIKHFYVVPEVLSVLWRCGVVCVVQRFQMHRS